MNKCVYLHKDSDGIVRYVGQGSLERAYCISKTRRSKAWWAIFSKTAPVVEIIAENLNQETANKLEEEFIWKYRDTSCNIRPVTVPHEMTFEEMNEWFCIDIDCPSGLRWKKQRPRSRSRSGDQAGSILRKAGKKEYWQVKIFNTVYKVHRIVYLLANGNIEKDKVVDHIDGDGKNNKPDNLRLVTHFENAHNKTVSQNKKLSVKNVKESRRFYFGVFEVKGKVISLKVKKSEYPSNEVALNHLVSQIEKLRQQCVHEANLEGKHD